MNLVTSTKEILHGKLHFLSSSMATSTISSFERKKQKNLPEFRD